MATITDLATTFDLPNYVGPLFNVTPTDCPLITAMGAINGGKVATSSTRVEWQSEDLRSADQRTKLEGQDAPQLETRSRSNITNTLQIVQEAYGVSYTKQAATGQFTGENIAGSNPVTDEFAHQGSLMVKQIKRDLEWAFINGLEVNPGINTTARATRGIIDAIETNADDPTGVDFTNGGAYTVTEANPGVFTTTGGAHGLSNGDQVYFTEGSGVNPTVVTGDITRKLRAGFTYYVVNVAASTFQIATTPGGTGLEVTDDGTNHATRVAKEAGPLTDTAVLDIMQSAFDNGGIMQDETRVLMTNSWNLRGLTDTFVTAANYQELSREMGGVGIRRILTDFGSLNVMLNRHMPNGAIAVLSMEQLDMAFLPIPGKGFLFSEILSKTGAEMRAQIYGEMGLMWGNERTHGLLTGLTASA